MENPKPKKSRKLDEETEEAVMMLTLGYGGVKKRKVLMQEQEKVEVEKDVEEEIEKGAAYDEEFVTAGNACLDDINVDKQTTVVDNNSSGEVEAAVSEKEDVDEEENAAADEERVVDFTLLSEDELGLTDEDEPMEEFSKPKDNSVACDVCKKTFNGAIGLKRHIGRKHKDLKVDKAN